VRTKNLTPFPLGTKLTSTRPPQPEMVLVVRGRFDLVQGGVATPAKGVVDAIAQGPLSGDVVAEGDEERLGELVYPSDFADAKLRGEVILRGSCHVPGGRPRGECQVSLEVGAWSKTLSVLGPRSWQDGLAGASPREPASFSVMPLRWAKAFGGPGCPENPVGVSLDGDLLPNIELPGRRIERRGDRPPPAGFGPINPAWTPRAGKVGARYGATYAARAPYYAEDFDWTHFQAAPPDQQFDGFFAGDEEVVLKNLRPDHAVLRTRLPGLRVRCFVNDIARAFREVRLLLDTLFIDADAGQILLTWRGRTPVADTELDDVTTVLVASEPLAERPREVEHYRGVLERFEADPLEISEHVPPEHAALLAAKGSAEKADALAAIMEAESPGALAEIGAATPGGLNVRAKIAEIIEAGDDAPPPVPIPTAPRISLGIDNAALAVAHQALKETAPAEAAKLEERLGDPRLVALDPTFRPPGAPPPGSGVLEPGADLSGRDFTGQDLRGADLSGCNLKGAILTRANLRGAKLEGANLEGVLLFKANLSEADLRGAELRRVNAASALLSGARLSGARLEAAYFGKADCREARFDGATGSWVFFTEADLTGASFAKVSLGQSDFEGACLREADLRGARLDRCLLWRCRAEGAKLDGASLDGSSFEESHLAGASFKEAVGKGVSFISAELERADLRWSRFPDGHFTKARAARSRFDCADLQGARFFKADLEEANLTEAKLVRADLCKTSLRRARFDGANLYDAKLLGAKGRDTSFEGANLKRCVRSP
jgi:uncharacterized protein YjbI with pentapeptide repeats